jgi:hypothetical protein
MIWIVKQTTSCHLKFLFAAGYRGQFPLLAEKRKGETLSLLLGWDRVLLTVRLFSPGFEARSRNERARHNRVAATNKKIYGEINQCFIVFLSITFSRKGKDKNKT